MATLAWIAAATVAGGSISIAIAALFALSAPASWVPALVSFAIGSLLGAVFLEILPHAIGSAGNLQALFATVLAGILGFFVLEKLVLWRHCHIEDCEAHDHHAEPDDRGRSGLMIIIGDGFHNFVDGILIAAAFLQSTELGVITAAAIIAHEIPQEIGDFVILLHSGYSKLAALALNLLSSLAMLVGALLAYFTLRAAQEWIGTVLALAAASMIYVAVADLIPGLHRRPELRATAQQVVPIELPYCGHAPGRAHRPRAGSAGRTERRQVPGDVCLATKIPIRRRLFRRQQHFSEPRKKLFVYRDRGAGYAHLERRRALFQSGSRARCAAVAADRAGRVHQWRDRAHYGPGSDSISRAPFRQTDLGIRRREGKHRIGCQSTCRQHRPAPTGADRRESFGAGSFRRQRLQPRPAHAVPELVVDDPRRLRLRRRCAWIFLGARARGFSRPLGVPGGKVHPA